MADIDGLKQRIELIDLRLKTAHSARERESAALTDMWAQIRDRFQSQKSEILALRDQVRALEDARDELQTMVDNLLGAVEGGLERMSDETIANIRKLAGDLLDEADAPGLVAAHSEATSQAAPSYLFEAAEPGSPDLYEETEPAQDADDNDEFLSALERSAAEMNSSPRVMAPDDDDELALDTPLDEPISPGIRDLIARIEDSVGEKTIEASDDGVPDVDDAANSSDELNEDLLEIEQLRNELLGLRERISGSKG